jgi:hypothetical protein
MFRFALRSLFLAVLLWASLPAHGGVAEYADRGKIDFDTAMQLLNPYGTWAKAGDLWAYTPFDHQTPYTHGRWVYTEYGWYWKGTLPYSWATEHYGYWKRDDDNHVWSWYPGPFWLPEIVELRATATDVGWRSAAVDEDGSFIESPADRYAKTDEWTFVTKAHFTGPITPELVEKPEAAANQLDDSSASQHTYVTYRAIERPGPHPADFVALSADGGMFPPRAYDPEPSEPPPPKPKPTGTDAMIAAAVKAVPKPQLLSDRDDGTEPPADMRQVHYWITMSLPSYWTPPPRDAKPNEIYIYRPDIFQDQDGIERRISLWIDPASRATLGAHLRDVLNASPTPASPAAPAGPGTPAVPATSASSEKAFRSPFDESFHGGSSSSKGSTPPGLGTPSATNAPPAQP